MTVDGFVFRVDMRLRYGSAGALVLPTSMRWSSTYRRTRAATGNTCAMIKARVVAGDQVAGARCWICCVRSSIAVTWTFRHRSAAHHGRS